MASATPSTALSAVSEAGAGSAIDLLAAVSKVSMVVAPSGTITGGAVALEASHDNTTWVQLNVTNMDGNPRAMHGSGGAYRYWRASVVSAITGGGTVSATLMEAG